MAEDTASGNRRAAKPAGTADDFAFRRYATLALGELVPGVTRAAYKRKSPGGALLLSTWEQVVGPRLAKDTMPQKLSRGVLTIACAGPVAMELQHLSSSVIERINTHAGERLVETLRFVQGVVAPPPSAPPAAARPPVAAEPIEDLPAGELNDALSRLRAAMRTRRRGG
jgi:hypothetical protein